MLAGRLAYCRPGGGILRTVVELYRPCRNAHLLVRPKFLFGTPLLLDLGFQLPQTPFNLCTAFGGNTFFLHTVFFCRQSP